MANSFRDINGKAITPGCKVVVATHNSRWSKRVVLRKGVVYRTSVKVGGDGTAYGGTVGLIIEVMPRGFLQEGSDVRMDKVKRTYSNLGAIMVVGE